MSIKKLQKLIRECEAEIENLKTLPYYTIFNRQDEQEADLKVLQDKLKRYSRLLNNNNQLTTSIFLFKS